MCWATIIAERIRLIIIIIVTQEFETRREVRIKCYYFIRACITHRWPNECRSLGENWIIFLHEDVRRSNHYGSTRSGIIVTQRVYFSYYYEKTFYAVRKNKNVWAGNFFSFFLVQNNNAYTTVWSIVYVYLPILKTNAFLTVNNERV